MGFQSYALGFRVPELAFRVQFLLPEINTVGKARKTEPHGLANHKASRQEVEDIS